MIEKTKIKERKDEKKTITTNLRFVILIVRYEYRL